MNNKKNDIHHQENIGNTRHLKMPERLWKLVTKAAKK